MWTFEKEWSVSWDGLGEGRSMKDGPCPMAPVHPCPDVYTVLKGRSGRRNGGGKEHGKETNVVTS